jgi:hypothetical protein
MFHLMFDQSEFDAGAVNPERANNIKLVGLFNSINDAKDYLKGMKVEEPETDDPEQWAKEPEKRRYVLAPQKPYTAKQLGV